MSLEAGANRPRGTRDLGPDEMRRRLAFLALLEDRARRHGFARIETPMFEHLDLFTAKSGDSIVNELYAFDDKGGRALTLRPELTAPVMRFVAAEFRSTPKPLRLAYFGSVFRYEEFKLGRWREFTQYGVELIGAAGPLADAETIALAVHQLTDAGLIDWHLRVGHVGILHAVLDAIAIPDTLTPQQWSDAAAKGWTRAPDDAPPEAPRALTMRLLDKADWPALEALLTLLALDPDHVTSLLRPLADLASTENPLPEARSLLDGAGVDTAALDELEATLDALALLCDEVDLRVDLTVARGLDYYTGAVFEAHVPELGGESQVLGGGAYRLLHLFGLPDLDPAVGFGLGFDRVLLALERQAERLDRDWVVPGESDGPLRVAVLPFRVEASTVLGLVKSLRGAGYAVDMDLRQRNLGRGLKWAAGSGAAVALIVGPQDLEAGQCTLRRLSDGEQREVPLQSLSVVAALSQLATGR